MLVCVCGVNCFRQGKHIRHSIDTIPLFESSGNVIVAWMFSRLVRVNKNPSPPPPCVTFYISLSLSHTFQCGTFVYTCHWWKSAPLFLFYFIFTQHTWESLVNNRWWRIVFPLEFVCVQNSFFFLLPAPRKSLIIRNVTQSRFLALHIREKKLTPTGLERNLSRKCTSGRETFSKYFYIEK